MGHKAREQNALHKCLNPERTTDITDTSNPLFSWHQYRRIYITSAWQLYCIALPLENVLWWFNGTMLVSNAGTRVCLYTVLYTIALNKFCIHKLYLRYMLLKGCFFFLKHYRVWLKTYHMANIMTIVTCKIKHIHNVPHQYFCTRHVKM